MPGKPELGYSLGRPSNGDGMNPSLGSRASQGPVGLGPQGLRGGGGGGGGRQGFFRTNSGSSRFAPRNRDMCDSAHHQCWLCFLQVQDIHHLRVPDAQL